MFYVDLTSNQYDIYIKSSPELKKGYHIFLIVIKQKQLT